jgi:proteasome accessory factor B
VDEFWTELILPYGSGESLADELLSFGPDVIVVDPPEVRTTVISKLTTLARTGDVR